MMDNLIERIEVFSELICTVEKADDALNSVEEYFQRKPINKDGQHGRVWILIGKDKQEEYHTLMVAQSEDIQEEINKDIGFMFNLEYLKKKTITNESVKKDTVYNLDIIENPVTVKLKTNGNTYDYPKECSKRKRQYLYRKIHNEYKDLKFYEIDIDEYLQKDDSIGLNSRNTMVYELAKDYLAEAKLAVEYNAVFWDYYNSGVGKRAYLFFKKKIDNSN